MRFGFGKGQDFVTVPLEEIHEGCKWPLVKQRCNITAAVCHAKNQHVRILQTIYYDVLAYRETPRANAKVVVARAAQVGMACKKEKSVGDGIDQAVGDFKATSLLRCSTRHRPSRKRLAALRGAPSAGRWSLASEASLAAL